MEYLKWLTIGMVYTIVWWIVIGSIRNIIDKKLYVFSSSALRNNRVSTWFDWMSFWMFYREICKMRSSPCCSQYCPPAGRQGGGRVQLRRKTNRKKAVRFHICQRTWQNPHYSCVWIQFQQISKSRSQATQSLKNKTWWGKATKLICVWLNWCHSWRKWS